MDDLQSLLGDLQKDISSLKTNGAPLQYKNGSYVYGFTTKKQGDVRKPEVVDALVKELGIKPETIVRPSQSHGTNISVIDEKTEKGTVEIKDCDGLITKEKNVFLSVMTADCVSVIYVDMKNGVIGVSHQGWKGSLARMAQKMVDKMVELGAEKSTIQCILGPSIGEECYTVEKDRFTEFKNEFFSYYHLFAKEKEGNYSLNLNELNVQQLLETGIGITNISSVEKCTSCEKDMFYSYRRDSNEDFGEMLSYIIQQ
jgi:YfiH family protein